MLRRGNLSPAGCRGIVGRCALPFVMLRGLSKRGKGLEGEGPKMSLVEVFKAIFSQSECRGILNYFSFGLDTVVLIIEQLE